MVSIVNKHLYINKLDIRGRYQGCDHNMHSNRVIRVSLISLILLLSLLNIFIIQEARSASNTGATTLYFKDYDPFYFLENNTYTPLSQNPPTKENDSTWPPAISKEEDFIEWLSIWIGFKVFEKNLDEFANETGFSEEELLQLLEEFGLTDPLQIKEDYIYDGEDTIEVKGDITFDLYFSSNLPSELIYKDSVKIIFYHNRKEIDNNTITLQPKLSKGKIQSYRATIENVEFSLEPKDILTFSIKIIPSDKPIGNIIEMIPEETLINIAEKIADLLNKSKKTEWKTIGETIKELLEESENISLSDIADLANTIRSSSFIYDSIKHPSSVTLPAKITSEEEDIRTYYLHEEEIMDENKPEKTEPITQKIKETPIEWTSTSIERNKILTGDAKADLYINTRSLIPFRKKIVVTAELYDDDTKIAQTSQEIEGTLLGGKPKKPTTFVFKDLNYELPYGHSLTLKISATNRSKLDRRTVKIYYDCNETPSSLTVEFKDTDNIQVKYEKYPEDEKIIPGRSIIYILNITSKHDDNIEITTAGVSDEEKDAWHIKIILGDTHIKANGSTTAKVFVNSTDSYSTAYGNTLNMSILVTGKTGAVKIPVHAQVSRDAIKYSVEIVGYTKHKNIKKGENSTFYFIIKNNNTAAKDDVDSYTITATSKNNWTLKYTHSITDLETEKQTGTEDIKVTVFVPKNTSKKSDTITFKVISNTDNNAFATVNVTVTVIEPNILEILYEFFENTAHSLGLDNTFGTYAPIILAAITTTIILLIIIVIILLLTRKFVEIICLERIKEINPDETAKYEITLQNKHKKTLSYELTTKTSDTSNRWNISIDTEKLILPPSQSKKVLLTVKPTSHIRKDDWIETTLIVKTIGKRKTEEITTMTTIKDGKTDLKITNVFTWPRRFKPGDHVTTSFRIENHGNVAAQNVKATLYINGREKNKVEELTIPSKGYAYIRMPWTASKGKNKISIKIKEK